MNQVVLSEANSLHELEVKSLTEPDALSARDLMLAQMMWIRQYTLQLIESVPDELWYVLPGSSKTHLAWQVGHLAVAQYGLMLFRQRGRSDGDLELMPGWLRKQFGKGSQPSAIEPRAASPSELRNCLDRIDRQAHWEARQLLAKSLLEPTEMPYCAYPNKLGALLFCPLHESIHAGQIGVLRRLHGLDPLR